MKITFNEWVPVGTWTWTKTETDVCGICRVQFDGTCPSCTFPGESCPPLIGACNHPFHVHCIDKWLAVESSNGLCPMCRQPFVLEEGDRRQDQPDQFL